MKIVFFGTPDFAANVLKYLLDHHLDIVAVVTKPDRPKGRSGQPIPTPVKQVVEAHNQPIPLFQPEIVSTPDFANQLAQFQADLFVVVAYGEILKQFLLDLPPKGCINLHASLLPKYRGAAPIQRCIIEGEKESGVTIMHMVKKMDAGDMIAKVVIPIGDNMTAGELEAELCQKGSVLLLNVINSIAQQTASRTPQNHDLATLAPKIELEECELDWNKSAQELHNLARGATPEPGAWCYVWHKGEKKRLKIQATRLIANKTGTPGEIIGYGKEGLIIASGEQALEILQLQLEGKKSMTSTQFMQGIPKEQLKFKEHHDIPYHGADSKLSH